MVPTWPRMLKAPKEAEAYDGPNGFTARASITASRKGMSTAQMEERKPSIVVTGRCTGTIRLSGAEGKNPFSLDSKENRTATS